MRETRCYSVFPSNLDYKEVFGGLFDHFKRCKYTEDKTACSNIGHKVTLDSTRSMETRDCGELLDILTRYPHPKNFSLHSHWNTGKSGDLGCIVYVDSREISVTVESTDLNMLAGTHDSVRQFFHASIPPMEKCPVLSRYNVKKTVFLAHRFDTDGKAAALILGRFLSRLGFYVQEGEGYEARDIPSKVAERIAAQDIFLCIVTRGNHSWILSEAAYAKGLSKYIVLMCEEDIEFDKGILGRDYEYISFPQGCIEKAFTELLYAIPG